MQESESRRAAIVKRLRSLDISTKKELEDIIKLTSLICKTPIVLITLLDDAKQHIQFKIGLNVDNTHIEDAFCRHTIMQDGIMEVQDSLLDERFISNPLVTGYPNIRFYAGSPLKAQSGESVGSLCVIDQIPNALTEEQKQMLNILSQQVSTLLEFELSLKMLKEETEKVQESELKLKSIFQSSPTSHIFVNTEMTVLAFNRSAADYIKLLHNKIISEGRNITCFVDENAVSMLKENIAVSLSGKHVYLERMSNYGGSDNYWWQIEFNPVRNHRSEVIGVSIDSTNITERIKYKEEILAQNAVLREIAQMQSHEIRRPVANIIGLVDLLEDPHSEGYDQLFQFMKGEVVALDKKISNIVQLTNKLDV